MWKHWSVEDEHLSLDSVQEVCSTKWNYDEDDYNAVMWLIEYFTNPKVSGSIQR
jgi:hypothetical protein